jgi:hypothetical protein
MKKSLFLFLFIPLSIFAQKAKIAQVNTPFSFSINWAVGDTLSFSDYVIKTDTSIILFEPIIRPEVGKPYLNTVQKIDTFSISRKLGVIEFYATEFTFQGWKDYKKNLNPLNDPVLKESNRKETEAQKDTKRRKDYIDAIKGNKS